MCHHLQYLSVCSHQQPLTRILAVKAFSFGSISAICITRSALGYFVMPISQARVKSVPSGDTLVLTAVNNPSQERTLSLAFVSAPRIRREGDEVGATSLQY